MRMQVVLIKCPNKLHVNPIIEELSTMIIALCLK